MPGIIVIIPVYNENAGVLASVIKGLQSYNFTIVIVDDGSDIPVAQYDSVRLITHPVNLGQGAAIQTGFDYAKALDADIAITFDGDGQHDSSALQDLIDTLRTGEVDVALGSRFLHGGSLIPLRKKILLNVARWMNYLFTGLLLSDAHNGLRAFNKKALQKIHITENRMAHASEILFEIKKHKLKYKEVPVTIAYTSYSKKKGQSAWDSIKILFDLVLHKLFK
ncbi:MAG: glycosyltransferase family 2 protein [Flavisolibacter sp.]